MTTSRCMGLAAAAILGVAASPAMAQTPQGTAAPTQQDAPKVAPNKKAVKEAILAREAAIKDLSASARAVSVKIGELAISGKLPTDDKALAIMQQMVDELKQINERLTKLEGEVDVLKGWVEGQSEALPIMAQDIETLKKFKPSMYVQFQYRDSDQVDRNGLFAGQHSFQMRRIRIGGSYTVDSRTSIKATFDAATGTDGTALQLRDAILTYDIEPSDVKTGVQLQAGQVPIPLGFELERSSSEREFPERATYNRRMMDGERMRGGYIKYGVGDNAYVFLGGMNSLTNNDPEQRSRAAGPEGRLAMVGGMRYYGSNYDFGLSYFAGERPRFRDTNPTGSTSPRVDRKFLYLDGTYVGLIDPNVTVRAEAMWGHDRVPNTSSSSSRIGNDMMGWQGQIAYNLNSRNQIFTRYAMFDPNTDSGGNTVEEWGLGYRYYINPGAMVTASWEEFDDPALATPKYNVVTLRYQFKF